MKSWLEKMTWKCIQRIIKENLSLLKGLLEVLVIKKNKNNMPWTYVISDFNGEEIVGTF